MADLLIKHLKKTTEEHSALRSLYSQWDFDEKLIPKALQAVGVLFPHYSRHDESHSKQILVNIERILGSNISLLSATDTWLILEAAYWHDIGMVVPQADMIEALKDPGFDAFLSEYCSQPNHELYSVAVAVRKRKGANAVFDQANPVEMINRFRELMAEWFRRRHPARADQIVKTPMQSIGVNSPRTELIPSRLFRTLGEICLMHGLPFNSLISDDGLPYREAGLAQDDCHPRFVACMLRMGDLLDMDDNRFCPVMQRIAGENRPALSVAHEEKHSSIRHLRIDPEKIEVTAECQTVDGYLETFRWFEWLKKEIQDQMANWRDIVPDRALGLLPTLGKVSVSIGGNVQILRDGERPSFGLDVASAMELLQGDNLYDSKFACIREALQNAVDATCLRIWLEHREQKALEWITPDSHELKSIFEKFPVSFELKELDPDPAQDCEITKWQVKITDRGTGISKTDLEHMLKVGGSKRNLDRRSKIDAMPEWFKPSGIFGIGMQSLFMLTDSVRIKTKSILTNEAYSIVLNSPTGAKQGLVTLCSEDNSFSVPAGTEVSFTIKLPKFSKSYKVSPDEGESLSAEVVQAVDPVLDENFPYDAAMVFDMARLFNQNSLLPIHGDFITKSKSSSFKKKVVGDCISDAWRFMHVDGFDCRIQYTPSIDIHPSQSLSTLYRGQPFETKGLYFPGVQISIDLLSGSASSWLNFSRDKISEGAVDALELNILKVLISLVRQDLKERKNPGSLIQEVGEKAFSNFLNFMSIEVGGEWVGISQELNNAWLDLPVKNTGKTFRDYFAMSEWSVQISRENEVMQEPGNNLKLGAYHSELTAIALIRAWKAIPGHTISIQGHEKVFTTVGEEPLEENRHNMVMRIIEQQEQLRNRVVFKQIAQAPWDRGAFATEMARLTTSSWGNKRAYFCARGASFEGVDVEALALRDDVGLRASSMFLLSQENSKRVLLPFLFLHSKRSDGVTTSNSSLEELCSWVQPKLLIPSSLATVRKNYMDLINYIDDLMLGSAYRAVWMRARGVELKA